MSKALTVVSIVLLFAVGWVSGQDLVIAAQDAVDARRFREARDLYRRLAEQQPENMDYRVWIGRLSGWLNDFRMAEEAYDLVLSKIPNHSEALVGKAYIMMWQQRYPEAEVLLLKAEPLIPDSVELHLAWARHYHYQGRDRQAQEHVRQALAVEPNNQEAKELDSQILSPHRVELRLGYAHDRFSFAVPGNMGAVSAGYSGDFTRILGHYEGWEKFGAFDSRAGVSVTQRIGNVWLRGGAMWGPEADVLPRQDYTAGASLTLPGGLVLGGDYRHLRFTTAKVHVVSPLVEFYFEQPIWLQIAYYWSQTSDPSFGNDTIRGHSFFAQYNHQIVNPVILHLGYARGNESFSTLSVDRLGKFVANTYVGRVELRWSRHFSTEFLALYQERSNDSIQKTFGVSLVIRL